MPKNTRASVGSCGDRADSRFPAEIRERMARKIGSEVRLHADRPYSGTSAAMRDTKSLMQIQVTNIGSEIGWAAEPDQGVHVRAIHINLASMFVDDFTNLPDPLFENSVRRRIGHHQGAESFRNAARLFF